MRKANTTYTSPGHTRHVYYFANGYGASVIRTPHSYGYIKNLWELAVMKKTADDDWLLCYDTPITDNVIGWLSEGDVDILLAEIENLPKREEG